MKRKSLLIVVNILFLTLISFNAQGKTDKINLSGGGWHAMLDSKASWANDKLYLPWELPSDLSKMPYNPPTGGWQTLEINEHSIPVDVPMSMDEYFSGGINTKTYKGVSWLWREFTAPESFDGKLLYLNVARARMRIEVFINQKLAAYDIIGETPFSFDVTKYIVLGEKNQIAVRLTNPGGRRGWIDSSNLFWGKYCFPSNGRNFSTLGDIEIVAKPKIYIEDVFVKNILPVNGKEVEVKIEVNNRSSKTVQAVIPINIYNSKDGKQIKNETLKKELESGLNTLTLKMKLSKAKIWTLEEPNLYNIRVELKASGLKDEKIERFGLRTFQVLKGKSGGHNYYLNGKRFIFKTAIDWGYYAPTGDYATYEMAEKSVDNALAMGQNGISFHRNIGEPLLMQIADEKGLCTYEEPGGFHPVGFIANIHNKVEKVDSVGFGPQQIKEKIRRMIRRDRNHPSLIIYSLSNEDNVFHSTRREAMELINDLDNSRLIINTSGPWEDIDTKHIRPYEDSIRGDYLDRHTAYNRDPLYREDDFHQEDHRYRQYDDRIYFLGEVNPVSGPDNWYRVYEDTKASGKVGYDTNIYSGNHKKIKEGYEKWNLAEVGSKNIKTIDDVSMQAGRGMMYSHSRHAQSILCNNSADGYGLNGWSPGPQSEGNIMDWSSAILDEGRNIKAPADSYTYWTRPLQIALHRKNGKYFGVDQEVVVESNLVNHGIIDGGEYLLTYTITDGDGKDVGFKKEFLVDVEGGDCFAEELSDVTFTTSKSWNAGYITLHASLTKKGEEVANGSEQILLKNRASYADKLSGVCAEVILWDAAYSALKEGGATIKNDLKKGDNRASNIIVVGDITNETSKLTAKKIGSWYQFDQIISEVEKGKTLIVKFDKYWAQALNHRKILSKEVTEWGGDQTTGWLGNGWGYIDHFAGYQSTGNKGTIGTTAWEVPHDPLGFYPFESQYKIAAYGLYFSRPWSASIPPIGYRMKEVQPTLAVTLATINYGKGKIILNPCYNVDEENAFTDMFFYQIVLNAINNNY